MTSRIIAGDCLEQMRAMEPNSVDAIVCDPPYALTDKRDYRRASPSPKQRASVEANGGFMGCAWAIAERRIAYWERVAARYHRLLAHRAAQPPERKAAPVDPSQLALFGAA